MRVQHKMGLSKGIGITTKPYDSVATIRVSDITRGGNGHFSAHLRVHWGPHCCVTYPHFFRQRVSGSVEQAPAWVR